MTTTLTYPHEKKPKNLSVRIPAWIPSVEAITEPHGLDADRMRVLLHQFFLCYLKNSKIRRAKAGKNFLPDYFPVHSFLLRQTCSDKYLSYVNVLIEAGIIERRMNEQGTASYLAGGRAQLYRWIIPDKFYAGCSFRSESITGLKQIKAVLRTRDKHVNRCEEMAIELSNDNPVYTELFSCLTDIVFDEAFHKEIANQYSSDLKLLECEAVANKDFTWFTKDSFGHRLHHPITTMPKEYRKHLRFKENLDEPLVILDIKNSQPYFSSVIVNKDLINAHLPEFKPMLEHIAQFEKKPDFLLYRKLCVEGRLYEFLMEGMGGKPKDAQASHKVRGQIKELFFASVLFSRTRVFGEKSRFRESFRLAFPSVHKMFQEIKRLNETILPDLKSIIRPTGKKFKYEKSNNAYKLVACLMQRAESAILFHVISPRLLAAGIRYVTVHDSIILLPEHVEQALQIINISFESLGLPTPAISINE